MNGAFSGGGILTPVRKVLVRAGLDEGGVHLDRVVVHLRDMPQRVCSHSHVEHQLGSVCKLGGHSTGGIRGILHAAVGHNIFNGRSESHDRGGLAACD